ncbi:MAG: precorrin-3B C(17)-methyltransferase, partial [Hyphomicrobiaceae bacterium]
ITAGAIASACGELNIALASLAAILLPEGTEPNTDSDLPLRYGRTTRDMKSLGRTQGLTFAEAPTPDAVNRIGRPHGELAIVGVGPGDRGYLTKDARDALANAEDLVGYETYLDLVPDTRPSQVRYASGNRVEIERARQALDLAVKGRRVALVTSGDPGIFAMASAVMEALEAEPGRWTGLDIAVIPGISAMQTAAARIGAPLGHDFCTISLSDIRKPWDIVARRLYAAARADFVLALYNPASQTRREQIQQAKVLLLEVRAPNTPVVLGRNLGRGNETVTVTTLGAFDPDTIDMRTVLIIGSSQSRTFEGPGGRQWVYTPRTYGPEPDSQT